MRIKIYRDAIDPDDLEALKKLIADAGHEPEVVEGLPGEDCDPDEASVVILYPEDNGIVEKVAAVLSTGGSGCNVYGVWPRGTRSDRVTPETADDYAAGVCIWTPKDFDYAVRHPDECWQRPDSTERDVPDLPRHRCT